MTAGPVAPVIPGASRDRSRPGKPFRGKVVVLDFMEPHCTDICPIVSAEYVDAYRDLGKLAAKVVFAAVNVNQYHTAIAEVAAFSRVHQLASIPDWPFFTGTVPALGAHYGPFGKSSIPNGTGGIHSVPGRRHALRRSTAVTATRRPRSPPAGSSSTVPSSASM